MNQALSHFYGLMGKIKIMPTVLSYKTLSDDKYEFSFIIVMPAVWNCLILSLVKYCIG